MRSTDVNEAPDAKTREEERRLQEEYGGYRGVDPDYVHAGQEALDRWWDWKFGLRIHWSLYSLVGRNCESWVLLRDDATPALREQYEALVSWWDPSLFDADEWCRMMTRAGIRFFTFTTKHHDGFSMYDTKTRVRRRYVHTGPDAGKIIDCDLHYSIMETPFGRDVVRELVDAGREHELGIGLYFSHIDWFDSDFRMDPRSYQHDSAYTRESDPDGYQRMVVRHREQLCELCTQYGVIDLLSLDMGFPGGEPRWGVGTTCGIREDLVETVKQIRRLQPRVLIRQRGIGQYGDYCTPERSVPDDPEAARRDIDMPWQVIYPGGEAFSFRWDDRYKPSEWILHNLVDITAKGGCFQVGYGPRPDGTWDAEMLRRLEDVGRWLDINGNAIYKTRPYRVFREGEKVRFTRSKDSRTVFAFLLDWPEAPYGGGSVSLRSIRTAPGSEIRMLGLDHAFRYDQDGTGLRIEIPEWFQDPGKRPCQAPYVFEIQAQP
jgi:alpha-L-fucosidase